MKLKKLTEVEGGDSYEFAYSYNSNKHWSTDSVFLSDEDFALLSKFIDIIIEDFNYYGPNEISIEIWNMIRNESIKSEKKNNILSFFAEIAEWIKEDPFSSDYFIIYGI